MLKVFSRIKYQIISLKIMSSKNQSIFPEPSFRRQQVNNFLNNLLDLGIDSENQSAFIPATELKETDKAFYLKLEIPGIVKHQIYLELNSKLVIVRGERNSIKDAEDAQQIYSNFRYGKWQSIVPLPTAIIICGASAEYTDGIFELVLYKQFTI